MIPLPLVSPLAQWFISSVPCLVWPSQPKFLQKLCHFYMDRRFRIRLLPNYGEKVAGKNNSYFPRFAVEVVII